MSTIGRAAALAILGIFGLLVHPGAARADFVVGFDDVAAPVRFPDVVPGGATGPIYSRSGVTFDGGVVLNSFFGLNNIQTSQPNIYATSDAGLLSDGTRLPGAITATLDVPAFGVDLILVNGAPLPGLFSLTAFAEDGTILALRSIVLGPTGSFANAARLSVSTAAEIARFTVTTSQPAFNRNFAIDTVTFATTAVPEPSTLLMVAIGGMAWIGTRGRGRRRRARDPATPLT